MSSIGRTSEKGGLVMRSDRTTLLATLSLVSILSTSALTTVHHFYKLGNDAFAVGLATIGLPVVFWFWFRKTRRQLPLLLYGLVNLWIVIGFGIIDGFWDSTVKVYLSNLLFPDSRLFIRAPLGSFMFEVTGILTFIASMFAAYYGYQLFQMVIGGKRERVLKIVFSAGAMALLLLGVYDSYQHTVVVPASGVVRIGVIAPLRGRGALLTQSFLKAVEMAQEDLKDTKYRYELVVEDSGANPADTARAAQRLIKKDRVQAIVGGISASGRIVKPFANAAKIPHLCVCSVTSIGDGKYNFTNIPLAEDEATPWVREAQRRNIKSIVIVNQKYPSIEGHVRALREEARRAGLTIAYETEFDESKTDFSQIIAKAKAAAPDLYFISGFPPALDLLGKQLRDSGVHNVASIVALSVSKDPALFEGDWYTDSYVDSAFQARFEKKYPRIRFATHMMPYAYDSLKIVVQAFESGQDPAEYIRQLTKYPGTAGTLTKNPGEGNFRSAPVVWVIKDGKPALLTTEAL
jgi:branched-chain amino acid transport system substrate-binding protein